MALSLEQVKRIAHLARLELSEGEVTKFALQLTDILQAVEKIEKLDLSGIEPTAHATVVPTPFREDEVKRFGGQEEALSGAPNREGRFFKVPKVI